MATATLLVVGAACAPSQPDAAEAHQASTVQANKDGATASAVTSNAATTALPPEQLQVVVDTSASVQMAYNLRALAAVAEVVDAWPRPLPTIGRSPPQFGLTIQVRGVSGVSYAPASVLGTWRVDGIPAVEALPSAVTPDFTQRVIAHKRERAAAEAAYKKSRAQAQRTATALRRLRPKTTYVSEIHGAVSAGAQSFSPRGVRKLLLVSDLEQNREPQIAGSLKGVDVLIVHLCRKAAKCESQQRAWGRELRGRGASEVAFIRIERLDLEVETFLRRA